MNTGYSGSVRDRYKWCQSYFNVTSGLKKMQRAHEAPPRETSNSKEFYEE